MQRSSNVEVPIFQKIAGSFHVVQTHCYPSIKSWETKIGNCFFKPRQSLHVTLMQKGKKNKKWQNAL